MTVPWAAGQRLKVSIMGTKPLLREIGWRSGDLEGKMGIWTGVEGSDAIVQLDRAVPLKVPECYVQIIRPSIAGQEVVPIEGDNAGVRYKVTKINGDCVEVKDAKRVGRAPKLQFQRDLLVVVGK